MEIKIFAPVAIPTLNRYDHFKTCLESLERCTWADKTEVYVSLDYPPQDAEGNIVQKYVDGWKKTDAYLVEKEASNGFKRLHVYRQKKNLGISGPTNNYGFVYDKAWDNHDRLIATEDDNVFSPCFLDYMNLAMKLYQDDSNILTVSGYNHEEFYDQGAYKTFLSKDSCAWGIGLWKHKEKQITSLLNNKRYFYQAVHSYPKAKKLANTYPALYSMLNGMVKKDLSWGDVKRTAINILEGYRQLHPSISLVRNEGNDGSGEHCGVDGSLSKQTISEDNFFDFGEGVGPTETDINKKALRYQCLSKDNPEGDIAWIKQLMYQNTVPLYTQYLHLKHFSHRVINFILRKTRLRR